MFLKDIIVLFSFVSHMAKTKQFLLLLSAFFKAGIVGKRKDKAVVLIEVRRGKRKALKIS